MTGVQDGINVNANWCVSDGLGTCFDGDEDGITLNIDKVIHLDSSYIFFDGCNDVNMEVLVEGVQNGTNDDVGWISSGWLVTGFYGDADGITVGFYKVI